MKEPKVTITLEPAMYTEGPERDFVVVKLTNTVEVTIGQGLTKADVNELIQAGWTLILVSGISAMAQQKQQPLPKRIFHRMPRESQLPSTPT